MGELTENDPNLVKTSGDNGEKTPAPQVTEHGGVGDGAIAADPANDTGPSELDLLRNRCKIMGIKYSNNAGVEALRAKIAAAMDDSVAANREAVENENDDENEVVNTRTGNAASDEEVVEESRPVSAASYEVAPKRKFASARAAIQAENLKLVRLRITNLDPKKKDLPGEIITVANEYIGTVRKFVPFGEQTDNGYHVPYAIYKALRDRKFLQVRVLKRNGREVVESQWVREFALDVLPPLTPEELARIGAAQSARGDA